jgi:serine/threonine-protein kinase
MMRMRRQVERVQRLGSYHIEDKIGEGGMGKVYRASHALLRRPTAIKLIQSADARSELVQRFKREVEATSGLTHPNTIAIYDFGFTPEGIFYYAMEYLDGITVGRCVETDGAQPEARVIHLLRQACGSIAEAHAAGLVHRDLKPGNLMLCQRGGLLDFVKVLDFGLCRNQESDLSLTRLDALTGTPLYLAPEALESPEAVDARSDLYQLGAIGYYLLTGRHVFTGATVVDVLDQHLNAAPRPPSEVLGRSVAGDLESLLLACLEKKPSSRPSGAAALLAALDACADAGAWTQIQARAWWDRWLAAHPSEARSLGSSAGSPVPSSYAIDLEKRSGA